MVTKVQTVALLGLNSHVITVEVDISSGLYAFNIVGLPGKAVQEAKERIPAALRNSGFSVPMKRITVNLSPVDLIKNGPHYDLPIATAILIASGQLKKFSEDSIFWGELALAGKTNFTQGALVVASSLVKNGFKNLYLPLINANEAGNIAGIKLFGLENLDELRNPKLHHPEIITAIPAKENNEIFDFRNIKGQYLAKRTLEIAAVGGHNLLLVGSPGVGKTFMAKSLKSILPELSLEEQIEVSKIYSIAGKLQTNTLINEKPFRSPHHTSSHIALMGGGSIPKPGEITLAHRGILFLDEFTEFSGKSLEALRQPLEDKVVTIARANMSVDYPADFTLVAAMNPCKCGYYGDTDKKCICTSREIELYKKRISGPVLDRIDLQIKVGRVKNNDLFTSQAQDTSEVVCKRVIKAKKFAAEIEKLSTPMINKDAVNELQNVYQQLNLSIRAITRIKKVARSIASMEESEAIEKEHIQEAITYRLGFE